ncbi:hypothetical protein [Chryseobacterium sp. YR221]|uniref:hypothetical protein n=1 Tax=Chryseobacterium sp. YR221 TaxID=1500293 RepID=UPI0009D88434|nr:hypothetical protein [Chryseobacterium sp. YR221]SMC63125.1 hypothetical protein SAMN02787074_2167 [Chryseobacterium sp. YR221]
MDGSIGIKKIALSNILVLLVLCSCSQKDKNITKEVNYKYFNEFSLSGIEKINDIDSYNGNFYQIFKEKDSVKTISINKKNTTFYKFDSILYLNKGTYWYCEHQLPLANSEKAFTSFSKVDVKYIFNDSIMVWSRDYFNRNYAGKYAGQSVQLFTKNDTISEIFKNDLTGKQINGDQRLDILKKIILKK